MRSSFYASMVPRLLILFTALLILGCKPSGPASTHTLSSQFGTLAERAEFLNQYVTFRRTYETLDFDIMLQNNGGGLVPGPSDWDIRLVATVPESELHKWIPPGVSAAVAAERDWLKSIPGTLDLSGINQWYSDGSRVVGLDRSRRVVVYRLHSL